MAKKGFGSVAGGKPAGKLGKVVKLKPKHKKVEVDLSKVNPTDSMA
jgi:ribosomal protein L24